MKKKNRDSLKGFISIILAVGLVMTLLSGVYVLIYKISSEDYAKFWLDVFIIIISSISSAIIAYIVSIMQFNREKNLQLEEERRRNSRDIKMISLEMADNLIVLETVEELDFPPNFCNTLSSQISSNILNELINKIEVDDDIMLNIFKVNKKLKLLLISANEEKAKAGYKDFLNEYSSLIESLSKLSST